MRCTRLRVTSEIWGRGRRESDTRVAPIQSITATIGRINEIAASIAAAVEEQQSATQEIARSVEQAAYGTGEVSTTIGKVSASISPSTFNWFNARSH